MKARGILNKLKFGAARNQLWEVSCANFLGDSERAEEFELLEGKDCHTGTMYFCKTYLEAQFVMALENGVGLYTRGGFFTDADGKEDFLQEYIVVSKKPFK